VKIECQTNFQKKEKIFFLEGELDVHQVKSLKANLMGDLESEEPWSFILDLSKVDYLDSSGLGMLVYLKKEVSRKGGKFSLIHLKDQVLNVFKLTKLEDYFELS